MRTAPRSWSGERAPTWDRSCRCVPETVRRGLWLYDRSPTKQGRRLLGVPILDDRKLAELGAARLVAGCGNRTLVDDIRAEAAERFPQAPLAELFDADFDKDAER